MHIRTGVTFVCNLFCEFTRTDVKLLKSNRLESKSERCKLQRKWLSTTDNNRNKHTEVKNNKFLQRILGSLQHTLTKQIHAEETFKKLWRQKLGIARKVENTKQNANSINYSYWIIKPFLDTALNECYGLNS